MLNFLLIQFLLISFAQHSLLFPHTFQIRGDYRGSLSILPLLCILNVASTCSAIFVPPFPICLFLGSIYPTPLWHWVLWSQNKYLPVQGTSGCLIVLWSYRIYETWKLFRAEFKWTNPKPKNLHKIRSEGLSIQFSSSLWVKKCDSGLTDREREMNKWDLFHIPLPLLISLLFLFLPCC